MNTLKNPSMTPNELHSISASIYATPQIRSHTCWRVWTSLQSEDIEWASDIAPGSLRDSIRIIGMNRIEQISDTLCRMKWFSKGSLLSSHDMKRLQENMSALHQEKEALQHMVHTFSQKSPPLHMLRCLYHQRHSIDSYMNIYHSIRDIRLHSEEISRQIQCSEALLQSSSVQEDRTPPGGWIQRTFWWLRQRLYSSSREENQHDIAKHIHHLQDQLHRNEEFLRHVLIPEEKRQHHKMRNILASFACV